MVNLFFDVSGIFEESMRKLTYLFIFEKNNKFFFPKNPRIENQTF